MAEAKQVKRYYWLRLHDDFFNSLRIKKLRKIAGGDTYVIIYLKMQLLSLKKGGYLEFTGVENTFAEELALDLDEDPENVQVTLSYLQSCGLLECSGDEYFLPYVEKCTGSETASTQRSRECRARKKEEALQCNTDATLMQHLCNVEKEIKIEKEIDTKDNSNSKSESKKRSTFVPPTLDDVKDYIWEKGYSVDAERWFYYYESNGWMVGRNHMKNWKACIAQWNAKDSKDSNDNKSQKQGIDWSKV